MGNLRYDRKVLTQRMMSIDDPVQETNPALLALGKPLQTTLEDSVRMGTEVFGFAEVEIRACTNPTLNGATLILFKDELGLVEEVRVVSPETGYVYELEDISDFRLTNRDITPSRSGNPG